MSAEHENHTFGGHLKKGIIALLISIALSLLLHGTRAMHLYEELTFDAWTKGQQASSEGIFIVAIDDDSYAGPFGLVSPAAPQHQALVQRLIEAIVASGAQVVGVDIDTRNWDPELLGRLPEHVRKRVVWARLPLGKARQGAQSRARYEKLKQLQPCAGSVTFGDNEIQHLDQANVTGVVRAIPTPENIEGVVFRPFGEVLHLRRAEHPEACSPANIESHHAPGYIRFLGRQVRSGQPNIAIVPARVFLDGPGAEFRDSIVLLGVTYEDSLDKIVTPFGRQYGVALHADVVHSYLSGDLYKPLALRAYVLIDVALGICIILAGWWTRSSPAIFWLGLIGLGGATVVLSLIAFQFVGVFISFWPIILGVGLHEALEKIAPSYWETIGEDIRRLVEHWAQPQEPVTDVAPSTHTSPTPSSPEESILGTPVQGATSDSGIVGQQVGAESDLFSSGRFERSANHAEKET